MLHVAFEVHSKCSEVACSPFLFIPLWSGLSFFGFSFLSFLLLIIILQNNNSSRSNLTIFCFLIFGTVDLGFQF